MTDDAAEQHELSVHMANELITLANDKLEAGIHPLEIAAGMRHAAANFTAFAFAHGTDDSLIKEEIINDFQQMLEYYDEQHRGAQPLVTGLEQLVEQVKSE